MLSDALTDIQRRLNNIDASDVEEVNTERELLSRVLDHLIRVEKAGEEEEKNVVVLDSGFMTELEHEAMRLSGDLATCLKRIIGTGPQAEHDWAEAAQRIHAIQHTILAQAAARAYPGLYRPLGGWTTETPSCGS